LEKTGLRMKKPRLEEQRSARCSRGCFAGRSSLLPCSLPFFSVLFTNTLPPSPPPPRGYNHFGKFGQINFLNSVIGSNAFGIVTFGITVAANLRYDTDTYMGSCFCVLVRRLVHTVGDYIPSSASTTTVIPSVYLSPCDYFLL
ncbi:hypothetical protein B0H16DRAFT_1631450, partial [Mycena metata]